MERDIELLADLLASRRGPSPTSRAQTDVYLTEAPPTLNVTVDVAGLNPESLQVILDGDVLSIVGERQRPPESTRREYQHAEIEWGPFERHLRLAESVDPEGAQVHYEHGLLRISLPLSPQPIVARVLIGIRIGG